MHSRLITIGVCVSCAVVIASCDGAAPDLAAAHRTAVRNKATMQRWIDEGHNQGRLEIIGEIFSSDYRGHSPGTELVGLDRLRELERGFHEAFPDVRITANQMVAENDWVTTRWTLGGTHKPSGKRVEVTGMTMARFADGKIVEDWQNMDTLGLMTQLDALPRADR